MAKKRTSTVDEQEITARPSDSNDPSKEEIEKTDPTLDKPITIEKVLSKEEIRKLPHKSLPIVEGTTKLTKRELDELYGSPDLTTPANIINLIKKEISRDISNNKPNGAMIAICSQIESYVKDKEIGLAIERAYELGKAVMKEKLREHAQRKLPGPASLGNEFYWGKKIDDHYNEVGTKNKTAVTFAYIQTRKDWLKEVPDLEHNPVPSNDTLRKYRNMYLEQKKVGTSSN
jgi:hypothetical protein